MKGMFAGMMKMVPGPEILLQLLSGEGYLDNPVHERMAERLLGGKLSDIKLFGVENTDGEDGVEVVSGTALHPDGVMTVVVSFRETPKKTLDAPTTA